MEKFPNMRNMSKIFPEETDSVEKLLSSIVEGEFTKDGRKLVINDSFSCSRTELQSLVGGPAIIRGNFFSSFNELQSLIGAPHIIEGSLYCSHNPELISLEGSPREIGGDLYCSNNTKLASLAGALRFPRFFVFQEAGFMLPVSLSVE